MMAAGSRTILTLLIIINSVLLAMLMYEVIGLRFGAGDVSAAVEPVMPEMPANTKSPVKARSIEDYGEITSRPLFNQERRPTEITDEQDSEEEGNTLTLAGVVLTPEKQMAIIYSSKQEKAIKVPLWGWVEGWRLTSVEADKVTLHKGNRSLELELQRTSKPENKAETKK